MAKSQPLVAIVTGAGRGIGRAYALALAREGWSVVVNDLGSAEDGTGADVSAADAVVAEIENLGGQAIADGSDVSDWQAAGRLVERAVNSFGGLHGLVNNAGMLRDRTLANLSEQEWDVVLNVNLKGTVATTHHAARYWRALSKSISNPVRGSIVNTSSASGLYSNPGQGNYAAAKAGVASVTLVAAGELARYGVRANVVAPVAATRLTEAVMAQEHKERMDPAFVAPLIVYLLGAESAHVTGRIFEMGGGQLVVVDPPRPRNGFRVEKGLWTLEAIEQNMGTLLADLPAPMTADEYRRVMQSLPILAVD